MLPDSDESIARVTMTTDADLLPTVVGFVLQVTRRLGLADDSDEKLGLAVETVCRNVIEHAFDPDETGRYDIEVVRRPGQVVVAVEDRGLPFD